MTENSDIVSCDGERLEVVHVRAEIPAAEAAVILHGAGTARKERTLPLARDLASEGLDVVSFDFSGHGGSSGSLEQLSLERRHRQAAQVIDELVAPDHRLTLIGFSMSGQTVGDLLRTYSGRVDRIALCSPAVYSKESWSLMFSDGFTQAIRQPDAWRDSEALDAFARFSGRAVLAVPGEDVVIPGEVTFAIEQALQVRSDLVCLWFGDATHQLGLWFEGNPQSRQNLIRGLLTP